MNARSVGGGSSANGTSVLSRRIAVDVIMEKLLDLETMLKRVSHDVQSLKKRRRRSFREN